MHESKKHGPYVSCSKIQENAMGTVSNTLPFTLCLVLLTSQNAIIHCNYATLLIKSL